MEHHASERFVEVATVGDLATARLCAAMLESSGIATRLHGESLGPYAVTVGAMAVTRIWVPEPMVDDAVAVLTAAEIDHTLVLPDHAGAVADPGALPMRIVAVISAVTLAGAVVGALMRVF